MSDAPPRDSAFVQSLERGLAVVRALNTPEAQTLSDVAKATGLSRAAARRFLLTLDNLGYVEQRDGPLPGSRATERAGVRPAAARERAPVPSGGHARSEG